MRRLALTPRWLGGLALCLLAAAVFGWLGRWQWDRGQGAHGSLQNTAYAFNWWLFAALSPVFWGRALREAHRQDTLPAVPDGEQAALERDRAAMVASDADDPEVAAWNAWLAQLNARDAAR